MALTGGTMPENNGTQLQTPEVEAAPITVEALTETDLANEERRIALRLETRDRLLRATGKLVTSKCFHDIHGKPWLLAVGARRLGFALGLKLSSPFAPSGNPAMFDVEFVDDDVFIECALTADWPRVGSAALDVGTCDTQDQFFTGDPDSQAIYRQFLERTGDDKAKAARMLVGHIKKKAYANALGRVVTAVTGLSGMTWEELGQLGLALKEGTTGHTYTKGATRQSAAHAKKAVERMPIDSFLAHTRGSKAGIGGTIKYADKGAKSHKYTVTGDGSEITIFVRSTLDLPDFAAAGNEVWFPEVEVSDWKGKPMFWANKGIELAGGDDEVEPPA